MADAETAAPARTVRLQVAAARQDESGAGIARMPRSAKTWAKEKVMAWMAPLVAA